MLICEKIAFDTDYKEFLIAKHGQIIIAIFKRDVKSEFYCCQ